MIFFDGGLRFENTVSLGQVLSALFFLLGGAAAWTDVRWRIRNLESWKEKHVEDSEQRDALIRKLDIANEHFETLIGTRQVGGRRFTDPRK